MLLYVDDIALFVGKERSALLDNIPSVAKVLVLIYLSCNYLHGWLYGRLAMDQKMLLYIDDVVMFVVKETVVVASVFSKVSSVAKVVGFFFFFVCLI